MLKMNDMEPPEREQSDVRDEATEARRLADQSRQLRNMEYTYVVTSAADAVGRMTMADGKRFDQCFTQVRAVMVCTIDMITEFMVTGDGVSVEELKEITIGFARRQVPTLSEEDGSTLADGILRQLSNDADGGRAFEVKTWDIERDRPVEYSFRLLEYVTSGNEPRYRLTDKGMYVALVLMEGGGEVSDSEVVEMALHKAISRGRWNEVTGQAEKAYRRSRILAADIRARIQQARSAVSYDWSVLERALRNSRAHVTERRRATIDLITKVDEAATSPTLSDSDQDKLNASREALGKAEANYSMLSAMLVSAPIEFAQLCLVQAGRRVLPTIMPDLRNEVLRPFLSLPTLVLGEFVDVLAGTLLPKPLGTVIDVQGVVGEIETDLADMRRPAQKAAEESDVYVETKDAWGLEEAIRLEAVLAPVLPAMGETTLLSDLLTRISERLSGEPATIRDAALLRAILSDSDHFLVEDAGETFVLPGIARGDELRITRIKL